MKLNLTATLGLLLGCTALTSNVKAQTADYKWGLGLHAGITRANDDFDNQYLKTDNIMGIARVSVSRYLDRHIDLSLNAAAGDVRTFNTIINNRVTTTVRTADLSITYKFFSNKQMIRPYIFLGAGALYTDNFSERNAYSLTIPYGGGLRFSPFGERVQLDINVRQDATFNDHLDAYVGDKYYDNYLTYSAGLIFLFGKGAKDSDGDGVMDNKDQCPNTPSGVKVDSKGCPLDADGDGVADNMDKCPNTPPGTKVDGMGCPLDSDGDGVADYMDKCPNTPAGAKVDAMGCPLDTDGDGVADYMDKCPNTSANIKVDATGCPMDADGDGVADYLDKCPGTPAGTKVDNTGCPLDSDGDGVRDDLDKCPTIPGPASNGGCPEVKKADIERIQKMAKYINFETGKAILKVSSYSVLDDVVKLMNTSKSYRLKIEGHTDNVGKTEANMELSRNRAAAVRAYLMEKGIDESRVSSEGFGDTQPIDSNKSAAGRANNRRVELKLY